MVELIEGRTLRDVILLGYSFGGIEHGRSVFSYVPESMTGAFQAFASPDGAGTLPFGSSASAS